MLPIAYTALAGCWQTGRQRKLERKQLSSKEEKMLRRMEKEEEAVESEEATRSSEQKNRQGYLG